MKGENLNYLQLKERMANLRKLIEKACNAFFKKESKVLFDKYPELVSFSWKQYTPYFNDGDTCYFSAHTDYPDVVIVKDDHEIELGDNSEIDFTNEEIYDWENSKNAYVTKPNPDYNKYYSEIYLSIKKFLQQFEEDDLEELFGDHCQIIVTRKGAEVDEYDHD